MNRRRTWFWLVAPAIGALAGCLYWSIFDHVGTLAGSIVRGTFVGSLILFYEREMLLTGWRDRVRRTATPVFAIATLATYAAMIVLGNVAAGLVLHHVFGLMDNARAAMMITQSGFLYSFAASALVIFVLRIRDLIGPGVFANLLLGLYHRPIEEERIFMFLDVVGSTAFAERYGGLTAQAHVGRIFETLAPSVRRFGGAIDDYVGDMAMVTWTMRRGTRDAACLCCVLDFAEALEADEARWVRDFGAVPRFRAVLHCGTVVTAEIGLERHKIAYFGDVVNTTARLESLAKTLDIRILVSADLMRRIEMPPAALACRDLGTHVVAGRTKPLGVFALTGQKHHPAGKA